MNTRLFLKRTGLICLGLSLAILNQGNTARGDVSLPAIFGSHMVLQQKQKDKVWGKAEPGEEVTVSIAGQTKTTKAGEDGKWAVTLDELSLGEPLTMTVKGKNTITFDDILVGEVWVCSGQSNMQWSVGQSTNGDLEVLAAKYPKIRLISVPQVGTQEPQDNFKGVWEVCSPANVGQFSAVGFFFGRQLYETLDVPVGLIDDAWGGSACEAWIKRDILAADEKYKPMLERWTKLEQNLAADKVAYAKKLDEWKVAVATAKAEGKPLPRQPQSPDAMMTGNQRPSNIYNGVLKPTIGYGIRGAIWYQGETNAGRAYQYRDLFPLMIDSWRKEWGIGEFPFYWVQLADFMAEKPQPAESAWAELREAQTMTMSKLPNTGEAVIIDIGEANDIHPRNKQTVGLRLARWALARDYGIKGIPFQSPIYSGMEKQGNKIVVTFGNVPSVKTLDVADVKGFAIAGADKKFVWAKAKIVGNKVEVWSDEVAEPAAVRYGWADNPICNVYSADLPVTPFRTDDWAGVTAEAK